MRLIACHIENFGKLHDYSADFSAGTNIICEENGWGKSTFAAFIRAMFYGLEGERKRSVEENERRRYKPWQGGVFGGQLTFELEGREYCISRVFGDKEAGDEFELRDARTNLPSKAYSKKIGEEIFKINRESFLRTIFIGQSACETAATDDINAKIGKLADNSNDLNNFDAASARLTEFINALTPGRVSGSLCKRRNEIAEYERRVQDGKGISESMNACAARLHEEEETYSGLKIRLREAGEEQTRVSKLQSAIAKKSEWERLKKSASDRREEAERAREGFPGEVPAAEEIKREIAVCGDMDRAYERVCLYRMTEDEREEFGALAAAFEGGVPDSADIDARLAEASGLREIRQALAAEELSASESARLAELEPYFADGTEDVTVIAGKWNERNNRKAALPSNQAALTALQASLAARERQTRKPSALLFIGALAVLLGVLLAALLSPAGLIAAAAGIVFIIAGIWKSRKGAGAAQPEMPPETAALQKKIGEDSDFIAKTDAEVSDYLGAHGRSFEEHAVSVLLQEIMAEAVEYASLKKKAQRAADPARLSELEALRQGVASFLDRYGVSSSEARFADDLYELKSNASRFALLKEKSGGFADAGRGYEAYKAEITAFLEAHGYEPQQNLSLQLGDIRDAAEAYRNARRQQDGAWAELCRFEEENDVSALGEIQGADELPSLEAISRTIQELTGEMEESHNTIIDYNKRLENLQERYDEWEESRVRLEELKELQAEEQKKYTCVSKAKEKLTLAKEAMTAKYADPIRKAFGRYYELLSGRTADAFHVDANTAVTVDELGKQREINTLSCGCRDLIGICLRIALVDAMYQEETPVLIMDDPFTNLDDAKFAAAKKFLEKAAEKYQIIYFTCSNSRS